MKDSLQKVESTFHVYTDGSCDNKSTHRIGGWGVIIINDDFDDHINLSGSERNVSSQQMEMLAVIAAIHYIVERYHKPDINIYSDSAYIVNCFRDKWYKGWEDRNYLGVKNKDYWDNMIPLVLDNAVRFTKVKGHSGDLYNEMVDKLAKSARELLIKNS